MATDDLKTLAAVGGVLLWVAVWGYAILTGVDR